VRAVARDEENGIVAAGVALSLLYAGHQRVCAPHSMPVTSSTVMRRRPPPGAELPRLSLGLNKSVWCRLAPRDPSSQLTII
jgi:hypothetical protein